MQNLRRIFLKLMLSQCFFSNVEEWGPIAQHAFDHISFDDEEFVAQLHSELEMVLGDPRPMNIYSWQQLIMWRKGLGFLVDAKFHERMMWQPMFSIKYISDKDKLKFAHVQHETQWFVLSTLSMAQSSLCFVAAGL